MSPPRHRPEADDASTDAPLRVSEGRWFSFSGGLVVGIILAAAWAGMLYANMNGAIVADAKKIDDHEVRIRTVERDQAEMKSWVKDLHDWMSEDRRFKGQKTTSNP